MELVIFNGKRGCSEQSRSKDFDFEFSWKLLGTSQLHENFDKESFNHTVNWVAVTITRACNNSHTGKKCLWMKSQPIIDIHACLRTGTVSICLSNIHNVFKKWWPHKPTSTWPVLSFCLVVSFVSSTESHNCLQQIITFDFTICVTRFLMTWCRCRPVLNLNLKCNVIWHLIMKTDSDQQGWINSRAKRVEAVKGAEKLNK